MVLSLRLSTPISGLSSSSSSFLNQVHQCARLALRFRWRHFPSLEVNCQLWMGGLDHAPRAIPSCGSPLALQSVAAMWMKLRSVNSP